MIKLPLILVSYIGLFFMSLFSLQDVQVDNKIPSAIAPGQKKMVELTIRKGDIKGFSKLEIPVPVGFNISPEEIKGASFTFKAQNAKFVWMQLPEEAEFTITYYLETSSTVKGVYDIGGTFSYVKDNRRLDIKLPAKPLVIKDKSQIEEVSKNAPEALASNTEPETTKPVGNEQSNSTESTSPKIASSLSNVNVPSTIKREAEVVDMICSRTLTKISDTEYEVKLIIINNDITGFGKILETLPDHCKTEKLNDAGAVVTQDKNTIKFVWFEIPTSNTIEISYKISCLKAMDTPIINGQLSYTDNGNPMVVPVIQGGSQEPIAIAENPTPKSTQQETPIETKTTTPEIKPTQTEVKNNTPIENKNDNYAQNNPKNSTNNNNNTSVTAENKPSKTPVTSVPSAEKGISYKVQILAAHRVVNKTYFEQKFNFTDRFNIENHEGWVKYTTGSFAQYKEARDARESITGNHGKLPGPFVTAYNDGERITVQEALLITNQQWYK